MSDKFIEMADERSISGKRRANVFTVEVNTPNVHDAKRVCALFDNERTIKPYKGGVEGGGWVKKRVLSIF